LKSKCEFANHQIF
jgi:hypothetical protein